MWWPCILFMMVVPCNSTSPPWDDAKKCKTYIIAFATSMYVRALRSTLLCKSEIHDSAFSGLWAKSHNHCCQKRASRVYGAKNTGTMWKNWSRLFNKKSIECIQINELPLWRKVLTKGKIFAQHLALKKIRKIMRTRIIGGGTFFSLIFSSLDSH